MAVAILSPPIPAINYVKLGLPRRTSKRIDLVVASSSKPCLNSCFLRRDLVLLGLSSTAALIFPSADAYAVVEAGEDVKTTLIVDDINAYSFLCPVELPVKKFMFKWVESRKPERYSSAAPLSPNARQRIVSERVDIINNLVLSVSIGPPNSQFLTSNDKNAWEAKSVADSVLSDKSALPISTSQRVTEGSVLDAHSTKVDGEPYWYYEYVVRKSPTAAQESNLFRHNVAATAERDGYLYSLNVSTLSKKWEDDKLNWLLGTMMVGYILDPKLPHIPDFMEGEPAERKKRGNDELICRELILYSLSNRLHVMCTREQSTGKTWEGLMFN